VNWDEVVCRVTLLAVILGLVWLVFAPMPNGEPLLQLTHGVYIA
jgi:hypothetical protein